MPRPVVTHRAVVLRGVHVAGVLARHGIGWLLEVAHLGWLVPIRGGRPGGRRRGGRHRGAEHVRSSVRC